MNKNVLKWFGCAALLALSVPAVADVQFDFSARYVTGAPIESGGSVPVGTAYALSWGPTPGSTPISSCVAGSTAPDADHASFSGSRSPSGSQQFPGTVAGTYIYSLSCYAVTGEKVEKSVRFTSGTSGVIVKIDTADARHSYYVGERDTTTLVWGYTPASSVPTSCSMSSSAPDTRSLISGSVNVQESRSVPIVNIGTYTYTLTCSDGATSGTSAVQFIVSKSPPVSMSFSELNGKTGLASGDTATLKWEPQPGSGPVSQCSMSSSAPDPSRAIAGSVATSDVRNLGSLTVSGIYRYVLSCFGPSDFAGPSYQGTVQLSVSPVLAGPGEGATFTGTVNPSGPLGLSRTDNLAWNFPNATACTASGSWTGSKPISGSAAYQYGSLAAGRTYNLTCVNAIGTVVKTVKLK